MYNTYMTENFTPSLRGPNERPSTTCAYCANTCCTVSVCVRVRREDKKNLKRTCYHAIGPSDDPFAHVPKTRRTVTSPPRTDIRQRISTTLVFFFSVVFTTSPELPYWPSPSLTHLLRHTGRRRTTMARVFPTKCLPRFYNTRNCWRKYGRTAFIAVYEWRSYAPYDITDVSDNKAKYRRVRVIVRRYIRRGNVVRGGREFQ